MNPIEDCLSLYSSASRAFTASIDLMALYPRGLQPRVLGPWIIPIRTAMSSSWRSWMASACLASRPAFEKAPCFSCAWAMRCLPSAVRGPFHLTLTKGRPSVCTFGLSCFNLYFAVILALSIILNTKLHCLLILKAHVVFLASNLSKGKKMTSSTTLASASYVPSIRICVDWPRKCF